MHDFHSLFPNICIASEPGGMPYFLSTINAAARDTENCLYSHASSPRRPLCLDRSTSILIQRLIPAASLHPAYPKDLTFILLSHRRLSWRACRQLRVNSHKPGKWLLNWYTVMFKHCQCCCFNCCLIVCTFRHLLACVCRAVILMLMGSKYILYCVSV